MSRRCRWKYTSIDMYCICIYRNGMLNLSTGPFIRHQIYWICLYTGCTMYLYVCIWRDVESCVLLCFSAQYRNDWSGSLFSSYTTRDRLQSDLFAIELSVFRRLAIFGLVWCGTRITFRNMQCKCLSNYINFFFIEHILRVFSSIYQKIYVSGILLYCNSITVERGDPNHLWLLIFIKKMP